MTVFVNYFQPCQISKEQRSCLGNTAWRNPLAAKPGRWWSLTPLARAANGWLPCLWKNSPSRSNDVGNQDVMVIHVAIFLRNFETCTWSWGGLKAEVWETYIQSAFALGYPDAVGWLKGNKSIQDIKRRKGVYYLQQVNATQRLSKQRAFVGQIRHIHARSIDPSGGGGTFLSILNYRLYHVFRFCARDLPCLGNSLQ